LRQLQFFVHLVKWHSFSKAADECMVSQSTLSAGIKELEHLLGVRLVERSTRQFSLTAEGREVAVRAEALLADAEDLARAVESRAPLSGELHLGIIPTIGPFLMPKVMDSLAQAYPELEIYLREDLSSTLIDNLHRGNLDMILMAFPYPLDDCDRMIIGEDYFQLVSAPSHRFATRKRIRIDELDASELLLLEDGHCLRDHALSACRRQSRKNANIYGGTSLFTLVQMVRAGKGATLLPQMAISMGLAEQYGLCITALTGAPKPKREIGLAWRKGSGRNIDAAALHPLLSQALER